MRLTILSLSYNHSKVTNRVHPVKRGAAYESQDLKLSEATVL